VLNNKTLNKILILLISSVCFASNHPIVLIHGFMGWGRDEMEGYYYWGGFLDLESYLREQGFSVYTVSVGPLSSNWDRAIEAYYQIKGGQLDYGKEHSKKYNLNQKPKDKVYEGLIPAWDEDNPIHIIAHSQGGQTARMLETMLIESFPNEESTLLKKNNLKMIKSITTFSTPHNGTSIVEITLDILPFAAQNIIGYLGITEKTFLKRYYDFDLDHWDTVYNQNNLFNHLIKSDKNSIDKNKNICIWDLSIEGSKELNKSTIVSPHTYYFSYGTTTTTNITILDKIPKKVLNNIPKKENVDSLLKKIPKKVLNDFLRLKPVEKSFKHLKAIKDSLYHIPIRTTSAEYVLPAFLIGYKSKYSYLYENDGMVNTASMKGPEINKHGSTKIINYTNQPQPGIWQYMGAFQMDHDEIIGQDFNPEKIKILKNIYLNHCKILSSL